MKRRNIWLALAMVLALSSVSHALLRDDVGYVHGKVVELDKTSNQITVDDFYTGKKITFTVSEDQVNTINPDKEVALTYDLATKDVKYLRIVEPR